MIYTFFNLISLCIEISYLILFIVNKRMIYFVF